MSKVVFENKIFFENLFTTKDQVVSIEKEATKQATYNKQKSLQENRITSSNAQKFLFKKIVLNHCLKMNSAKKKKIQSLSKMP